jgi:hypothetical protein
MTKVVFFVGNSSGFSFAGSAEMVEMVVKRVKKVTSVDFMVQISGGRLLSAKDQGIENGLSGKLQVELIVFALDR